MINHEDVLAITDEEAAALVDGQLDTPDKARLAEGITEVFWASWRAEQAGHTTLRGFTDIPPEQGELMAVAFNALPDLDRPAILGHVFRALDARKLADGVPEESL
jgi:hypothetical protein